MIAAMIALRHPSILLSQLPGCPFVLLACLLQRDPTFKLVFIESICNDESIIRANVSRAPTHHLRRRQICPGSSWLIIALPGPRNHRMARDAVLPHTSSTLQVRETKLKSPDYRDVPEEVAVSDFLHRWVDYGRVHGCCSALLLLLRWPDAPCGEVIHRIVIPFDAICIPQ